MTKLSFSCWMSSFCFSLLVLSGCTTTRTSDTARTGVEQLLISNAVDQALDKVDFSPLVGRSVFLETKYLDCTDKNYLVAALRHEVMMNGAKVVEKIEDAEQIVEIRSGSVGTDRSDSFFGSPSLAVPGPLPISLPEVRVVSRQAQYGTAKLGLVMYDAKTKQALGNGGTALARSDETKWLFMGMPVHNSGSVRKEINIAGANKDLPTVDGIIRTSGGSVASAHPVQLVSSLPFQTVPKPSAYAAAPPPEPTQPAAEYPQFEPGAYSTYPGDIRYERAASAVGNNTQRW